MAENQSIDGGLGIERAKTEHRVSVEAASKFRFFFVGLVFAMLSFAIQFPMKAGALMLKVVESSSWALLAISGLLALADIGGFSAQDCGGTRLSISARRFMWLFFLLAVALLLTSKILASF